jgi:hypothetical protein
MRRPQFTLKSMLWLTALVGAVCAGTQFDRYLAERRADPIETRIWAALEEKTVFDFTEQPLFNVVECLGQLHDINIQLDGKALSDAGIGSDVPITRNVKGVTLRSALKLLLSDLDLTYVVHNGVLMITVKTEAQSTRYSLISLKTTLWLVVMVAAFLGGIQCDRAWRRRADKAKA